MVKDVRSGWAGIAAVALILVVAGRTLADECGSRSRFRAEYFLNTDPRSVYPGEHFTTTFAIRSNRPVQGFNFFIDFNEETVEFLGMEKVHQLPAGKPYEVESLLVNTDNVVPNVDWHSTDEGYITGQVMLSSTDESLYLPAAVWGGSSDWTGPGATPTRIYDLHFRVLPGVDSYEAAELNFFSYYQPGANLVRVCGQEFESTNDLIQYGGGPLVILPGMCDPYRPPPLDAVFQLGDAFGTPGGMVKVSFSMEASEDIGGFSFSIDFDEEVIQATSMELVYRNPAGGPWTFEVFERNNSNQNPGGNGVDEGYVTGAVVFSATTTAGRIPAHQDTPVLDIHFHINPEAAVKTTEVRFLDGADPWADGGVDNVVTVCNHSVAPSASRSFVFVDATIGVIDEITIFIRGDSNGDGKVHVSDAVAILSYLYLGGTPLACYDAGDVTDDGRLDLSDAVAALGFLFTGTASIPPPFRAPGPDPTADSLGCLGIYR